MINFILMGNPLIGRVSLITKKSSTVRYMYRIACVVNDSVAGKFHTPLPFVDQKVQLEFVNYL